MKKLFSALAVGLVALAVGACSTVQQQSATAALAKLQADVSNGCLVVQPTLMSVAVIDPVVATAATANGLFCAANAAINVASVSTIVNTSVPATEAAVNSSALIPANQKPVIIGALTAFQIALSTALIVYNQSTAATVPPAPAAASGALAS